MSYLGLGGTTPYQGNIIPVSAYFDNSFILGKTGPTGPTGESTGIGGGGNTGPTGPTGPVQSIGFDGGNAATVYSMGPVFDCGRAE